MKNRLTVLLAVFLMIVGFRISAQADSILIGDNDGYGYGNAVVPDGADLPPTTPNPINWLFDNRSAAELAATDGSQYTDFEECCRLVFSFLLSFAPANAATVEFDVSGIQTAAWGPSTLYLDGVDFSSALPLEQGTFGSGVFSVTVPSSLIGDGVLTVDFASGANLDHVAFDFFELNFEPSTVPEPSTLLLLGMGLSGLGVFRKRIKR